MWCLILVALASADLRGTVVEVVATGASGSLEPALSSAVSRALVAGGATVLVGSEARAHCGSGCVRLSVVVHGPGRLEVRAEQGGRAAHADLVLPADASLFEQARAIAVQVRLVIDWDAPAAERPRAVAAASPAPAPSEAATSAPAPSDDEAPPAPAPSEDEATPVPAPSEAEEPAPEHARHPLKSLATERPAPAAVVSAADRLSLDVGAATLGDLEGAFLIAGVQLGARLRLSPRLDARLRVAFVDAVPFGDSDDHSFDHLRPVSLVLTAAVPGLEDVRAGLGTELVFIDVNRPGEPDDDDDGSFGGLATVEYGRSLGRFGFSLALQAAMHPATLNGVPGFAYPTWTVGGSVGLRFSLL